MKKFFSALVALSLAAGFMGCDPGNQPDPKPVPDPTPDPVIVEPANNIVVYQANEKIFAKTQSFAAVDARLDEIEALGVNVLWLMPIHPIGQKNSVNSPYCVKDFKGVNANFGTLDDLKTLVNHAHAKKMRVILDWIANHSALDHPWVEQHPDWYGTPSGDEKNWNDVKPFNFNNRDMRAAMIDAMTYWMREADVDGFRCDFAQGCPDDFWKEAIDAIRAVKKDAIMLAETSRTQLYDAGFDWMYSWAYLGAIQKVYASSPAALYSVSDKEMEETPKGKMRLRYVTNHDACSEKSNQECYKSQEGLLAASCFTYFLEGVPLIYSSQEIGYMQKINFCVPSSSSVIMNWQTNPNTLAAYKDMMRAYHETDTLRGGKREIIESNSKVGAFTYTSDAGTLLVIINLSADSQTFATPQALINQTVKNHLTGKEERLVRNIELAAYEYKVVSLKK